MDTDPGKPPPGGTAVHDRCDPGTLPTGSEDHRSSPRTRGKVNRCLKFMANFVRIVRRVEPSNLRRNVPDIYIVNLSIYY